MKISPEPIVHERELYDRAVKLLTQKSRSQWELRRLLRKRCEVERLIDSVLHKCVALGYLDDVKYAVHLARVSAERKHHGQRRIALELKAKGIAPEIIRAALKEVFSTTDELDLLRQALIAKMKNKPPIWDAKKAKKLHDQLMQAGFETDKILREFRRLRIATPQETTSSPVDEG